MTEVLVLQHDPVESPGLIGTCLAEAGHTVRIVRSGEGEPVPRDLDAARALLVMGGPMAVYQGRRCPFLTDELRLIERAVCSRAPVLGVCLGSQLLAAAIGGSVMSGRGKEIGWFPVTLTARGCSDPVLSAAGPGFTPFHWHGDVFTLPRGAVLLARSDLTPRQAFRYGTTAYGLLFHLEVTEPQVAAMVDAFQDELRLAGVDGEAIKRETRRQLGDLAPVSRAVIRRWVGMVPKE